MNKYQLSAYYDSLVDWDRAIEMYKEGFSLTNVAKHYNVTYDFIRMKFIKKNVEIRQGRNAHIQDKKYDHRNIFKPMTKEGAYLLGWIVSDGNLSKDGQLRLWLSGDDKEHVDYLRQLISNVPLKSETRASTGKTYYGFGFKNADIHDTLRNLGVHPRKSFNETRLDWTQVPDKYIPYFLLGLFEGDGHIALNGNRCDIIMYDAIWVYLANYLESHGISATHTRKDNRWAMSELSCIKFYGENYFKLMTLLYTETKGIKAMSRKFERFKNRCEFVAQSKSTHKKIANDCLNVIKV